MAYTKPGVTVTQLQVTNSFPLPDPTLGACVIGEGYFFRDPLDSRSAVEGKVYTGAELVLDLDEDFGNLEFKNIIPESITVHLVRTSGTGPSGQITILQPSHFSYASSGSGESESTSSGSGATALPLFATLTDIYTMSTVPGANSGTTDLEITLATEISGEPKHAFWIPNTMSVNALYFWNPLLNQWSTQNSLSVYSQEVVTLEVEGQQVEYIKVTNTGADRFGPFQIKLELTADPLVVTSPGSGSGSGSGSGGSITINANIEGYTSSGNTARVTVGFLSERPNLFTDVEKISNTRDLADLITGGSRITWFNPLAFGAAMAINSSGSAVNIIGAKQSEYSDALDKLALKRNIYALAGLSSHPDDVAAFKSHVSVTAMPKNKKERIAFVTSNYPERPDNATTSVRETLAEQIKAVSQAIGSKRVFNIYPDSFWIKDNVFLPYLSPDFLSGVTNASLYARLETAVDTKSGRLLKGTKITPAVYQSLVSYANTTGVISFDVLVPVPTSFLGASLAGSVSIKSPADPMTNTGVLGAHSLYKTNDYFLEDHLDTIASGGTWVLEERGPNAVFNRHQMSTNALTVQERELSITHQIDYCSMYLRDLVSPLIGRFTISDNLLSSLQTAVNGGASFLIENGFIRDLEILRVYQSETNPDEVKCDVRALPLYPLNYFNYTITF